MRGLATGSASSQAGTHTDARVVLIQLLLLLCGVEQESHNRGRVLNLWASAIHLTLGARVFRNNTYLVVEERLGKTESESEQGEQ